MLVVLTVTAMSMLDRTAIKQGRLKKKGLLITKYSECLIIHANVNNIHSVCNMCGMSVSVLPFTG